ncbi:MAG: DUF115 domain-containing protein [Desulfobacterales bacterium]|nr:DUF115 domain-containing protein [Desulfobacterales bacterium]
MFKQVLSATRPARYWIDEITFKSSPVRNQLKELKDAYAGKPLLVVGNGPSLNNTPLDEFSNIPAIGMNKIDLLFDRVNWRPSMIVCINNLVIKQHWRSFVQSQIPVYLSWKGRWFVKRKFRGKVNYFLDLKSPEFSTELPNGIGMGGTVTYSALQIAYYMGANPVILFGVDHNFAFKGKPLEYSKRTGADSNHFDPNYFKEGDWWGLPDLEASEAGYSNAKAMFENDGRRIVDATIGGKLDIFEKVSVSAAKALCGIEQRSTGKMNPK